MDCAARGRSKWVKVHSCTFTQPARSVLARCQGATVRPAQRWDNVFADRHLATFRQAAARTSRPLRHVRKRTIAVRQAVNTRPLAPCLGAPGQLIAGGAGARPDHSITGSLASPRYVKGKIVARSFFRHPGLAQALDSPVKA
jgi:hypothetical protein